MSQTDWTNVFNSTTPPALQSLLPGDGELAGGILGMVSPLTWDLTSLN